MSKEKFKYLGTELNAFTLGSGQEVILFPGCDPVELPVENPHVKTLEAAKIIERVNQPVIVKPSKSIKPSKNPKK